MKFTADDLLLYAVTDGRWLDGRTIPDIVRDALQGGATMIQLREKDLDRDATLAEAIRVREICETYEVPLIINDDPEIALACGAQGVHLGQADEDPKTVRHRLGPEKIIGVSVRTPQQARAAQAAGADYLGVGAVFGTRTKTDAVPVSPETIRAICRSVQIPVVAIGGIDRSNASLLKGTGISGIAVIRDLFAHPDIEDSARTLKAAARAVTSDPEGSCTGRSKAEGSGTGRSEAEASGTGQRRTS